MADVVDRLRHSGFDKELPGRRVDQKLFGLSLPAYYSY